MQAQAVLKDYSAADAFAARAFVREATPEPIEMPGVRLTFSRDEEIFGEGEKAQYVYRMISGAVRTYRVLSDGRRQINDFVMAGDMLGLEAADRHSLSAEAVNGATLVAYRRSAFLDHANRSDNAGRLWAMAMHDLHRAQAHLLMLGRQSACERVAAFLLDMGRRDPGVTVDLQMSRQDIADYLGLTIETVSRTLTQLQGSGLIDIPSCRKIVLRNRTALCRICE